MKDEKLPQEFREAFSRRYQLLLFLSLAESHIRTEGAQRWLLELAGDASTEMNTRYTHHELVPLRAAISAIPPVAISCGH